MVQKLYVGNLPSSATSDDLRTLFSQHGEVHSVNLITEFLPPRLDRPVWLDVDDEETPVRTRSEHLAEVIMSVPADTQAAMDALNGHEFEGRPLNVSVGRQHQGGGGGKRW